MLRLVPDRTSWDAAVSESDPSPLELQPVEPLQSQFPAGYLLPRAHLHVKHDELERHRKGTPGSTDHGGAELEDLRVLRLSKRPLLADEAPFMAMRTESRAAWMDAWVDRAAALDSWLEPGGRRTVTLFPLIGALSGQGYAIVAQALGSREIRALLVLRGDDVLESIEPGAEEETLHRRLVELGLEGAARC